MRSAENIEKLVKNLDLDVDTNTQTDQAVLSELLDAQKKSMKQQPASVLPTVGRFIMKNPLTKLVAAAVVIIACLTGLSIWRNTGSGIALGEVLARMEQIKAFRYQWSVKMTGEDPNKPFNYESHATTLESQEYGKKSKIEELDPNGGENLEVYTSPDKRTRIVIQHKQKKYMRIELDDVTAELLWQENSPGTFLKRILECKYESMGRATIDGIEVEGFQTTDPNFFLTVRGSKGQSGSKGQIGVIDVKVWVDVKTRLPVRYDFTYVNWFDQGDKIFKHGHVEMHDFRWDIPVEAADFKPVIPDDYTGTVVK